MTAQEEQAFEGWAIVELMGHRKLAGRVSEQQIAGAAFLRLDVPASEDNDVTQFYSPSSIYCITPTTEQIARLVAKTTAPAPVSRYALERAVAAAAAVQDAEVIEPRHAPDCMEPECPGCLNGPTATARALEEDDPF